MAQPTGRFTWGLSPCPIEGVRAEDRKYQKTLKERESESAFVRAARIRKYENDREFVGDIPEAFTSSCWVKDRGGTSRLGCPDDIAAGVRSVCPSRLHAGTYRGQAPD